MLPFFHLLVQRLTAHSAQWVSFSEENLPVDILTNLKQRNIYTNLAEITDPQQPRQNYSKSAFAPFVHIYDLQLSSISSIGKAGAAPPERFRFQPQKKRFRLRNTRVAGVTQF